MFILLVRTYASRIENWTGQIASAGRGAHPSVWVDDARIYGCSKLLQRADQSGPGASTCPSEFPCGTGGGSGVKLSDGVGKCGISYGVGRPRCTPARIGLTHGTHVDLVPAAICVRDVVSKSAITSRRARGRRLRKLAPTPARSERPESFHLCSVRLLEPPCFAN